MDELTRMDREVSDLREQVRETQRELDRLRSVPPTGEALARELEWIEERLMGAVAPPWLSKVVPDLHKRVEELVLEVQKERLALMAQRVEEGPKLPPTGWY